MPTSLSRHVALTVQPPLPPMPGAAKEAAKGAAGAAGGARHVVCLGGRNEVRRGGVAERTKRVDEVGRHLNNFYLHNLVVDPLSLLPAPTSPCTSLSAFLCNRYPHILLVNASTLPHSGVPLCPLHVRVQSRPRIATSYWSSTP